MAKCYNCGVEIPDSDKTKLCDRCKKILLPFVKLVDASTSSAVRRLVSNERNLRNAGVTDSGMEYLLRLCEIHDKKRIREMEERNAAKASAEAEVKPAEIVPEDKYSDIELPADEPLRFAEKPYGDCLPAVSVILAVVGAVLAVWFVVCIIRDGAVDIGNAVSSVGFFAASYGVSVLGKVLAELNEIKKRFR